LEQSRPIINALSSVVVVKARNIRKRPLTGVKGPKGLAMGSVNGFAQLNIPLERPGFSDTPKSNWLSGLGAKLSQFD
nr:hypothetical protein [Leptolyngbyaceae cyanobacterium MO_188.B28]